MVAKWKASWSKPADRKIVGRWLVTVENMNHEGLAIMQNVKECRERAVGSEQLLRKKWADMKRREKEAKCRRVVLRMLHAKLTAGWGAWMRLHTKVCCSYWRTMIKRGMVKCLNVGEWLAQRRVDQGSSDHGCSRGEPRVNGGMILTLSCGHTCGTRSWRVFRRSSWKSTNTTFATAASVECFTRRRCLQSTRGKAGCGIRG